LNEGLRKIPITLTWDCCRDLLNLHLHHLIEAQLVLCSYCEAIHLGIDVLQEFISGMNLLANFIIYPYLIPDGISKRGLISIEILPITTLLTVVEWETRFVPPSIEALIRMKTLLELPVKLTSWETVRQWMPMWPVSPHSSHVTRVLTILR
jgi:hypothetical protein